MFDILRYSGRQEPSYQGNAVRVTRNRKYQYTKRLARPLDSAFASENGCVASRGRQREETCERLERREEGRYDKRSSDCESRRADQRRGQTGFKRHTSGNSLR